MSTEKKTPEIQQDAQAPAEKKPAGQAPEKQNSEREIGGFKDAGLPEPTRFGDWEVKGRCSDF